MRVALLSDVHGNVWALERVLSAIKRARPDLTVFLGDAILRCPKPRATMELLRSMPHRGVVGNADKLLLGDFPESIPRDARVAELRWTRGQLRHDDLAYLRALPAGLRLFEGTPQELLPCHASPGQVVGGIYPPPPVEPGTTDAEGLKLLGTSRRGL